jgi:peroxiredoxin Q/BCP
VILGASFDPPAENKAFVDAQGFPYRLLSDPDRSVGAAYGVEKGPDEQYAEYASRMSFLIDPEGVVREVYEVTNVAAHPQQVLDDLAELQG